MAEEVELREGEQEVPADVSSISETDEKLAKEYDYDDEESARISRGAGSASDTAPATGTVDGQVDQSGEGVSAFQTLKEQAKRDYRFSDDEVGRFSDADQLQMEMARLDSMALRLLQRNEEQQYQQPAASVPPQQQESEQKADDQFRSKLDPEAYDDLLIAEQNRAFELLQQQQQMLNALLWERQQQQELMQQQSAVEQIDWFDKKIEGLGDSWKPLLGSGPSSKIPQGSPEMSARERLYQATFSGMSQIHPGASRDDWFQRAQYAEFFDHLKNIDRQQLSRQVDQQTRRSMGRPSGRSSGPLDGAEEEHPEFQGITKKAVHDIKRYFAELASANEE